MTRCSSQRVPGFPVPALPVSPHNAEYELLAARSNVPSTAHICRFGVAVGRGLWVADDFPAAMVRAPLGLKAAGPETCPRRLCPSGDGPAGDVTPADVRQRFAGGIHGASTGNPLAIDRE